MNIILLPPEFNPDSSTGNPIVIQGEQAKHILDVIKPAAGDQLKVGVVNGKMGVGRILVLGPNTVKLDVELSLSAPPPLPATLILALPRPKVLKRILQSCTSLGIKQIYLINSYRVEKSYWQTPFLNPNVIQQQLLLGLEQSRDTTLPEVHLRKRFKPFVEDELPTIAKNKQCFTAHPSPENQPCPSDIQCPSVLAIGPEGGFIHYEIDKLSECGFNPVTLGKRILKVETAIPALIAKLYI